MMWHMAGQGEDPSSLMICPNIYTIMELFIVSICASYARMSLMSVNPVSVVTIMAVSPT